MILYKITIPWEISPGRMELFEGFSLAANIDGTYSLEGLVKDQSHLYSILNILRDMGIPLLRIESGQGGM